MSDSRRIFLSCASPEFENEGGPFAGLRSRLARSLRRAGCDVKVQEDFPQTDADVVLKTADYVRTCAAVVHLVGAQPGSVADAKARAQYLAGFPDPAAPFLVKHPDLRDQLGDCADLTYTQWEAFQAIHHGVPLFVYATDGAKAPTAQKTHLDRLRAGRKFASDFKTEADLLGRLIGDLHDIVPGLEDVVQRVATSRFIRRHTAEIFLGREDELRLLDSAWTNGTHVLSVIAWGGVGKTALLSHWIQTRFIDKNWTADDGSPLPPAYFDWSFYDQGTTPSSDERAVRTGSVGDFFEQALGHLGDKNVSLPGKGARLAGLVRKQRTLFVLDGLEPLQQPVGSPTAGRLLDPDLRDFIDGLAQQNPGLLVLTSRQALTDLDGRSAKSAGRHDLDDLPKPVAVRLLRTMQITGSDDELAKASDQFFCHALSLTLLGRFLFDAHGGDIRRIDRVRNLRRADELTREERHRSAWKVLEVYEEWLAQAKEDRNPKTLAVLRLTGLFDRTATAGCLAALREAPAIPGLTDALVGMADDEWNILLRRLERAHLLKLRTDGDALAVDAHPLIREYFAQQLREKQPEAFRAAHSRLFDHLCTTTPHRPDTLDGLQPLYQAVVHGCLAGRHEETCKNVYLDRILRGTSYDGFFSTRRLGAYGVDLAAMAAFFDEPWSRVTPNIPEVVQAWLMHNAAFRLRAIGRLIEALHPIQASLGMQIQQRNWREAANSANIQSELEQTLGRLSNARENNQSAIEFSDRNGDPHTRMYCYAMAADTIHQSGRRSEAGEMFALAEQIQKDCWPDRIVLYAVAGFKYCDWFIAAVEPAAWRSYLNGSTIQLERVEHVEACSEAEQRAKTTLSIMERVGHPIYIGLDRLTLARIGMVRAMLTTTGKQPELNVPHVAAALLHLRNASAVEFVCCGLLTAALYHFVRGEHDTARAHLDEAQQLAERGPMPLFLADVHLHRARMFRDTAELAKAAKLIRELGYGRRYEELADAEAVLGVTP